MGVYVNPENMTKEEWLMKFAEGVSQPQFTLANDDEYVYLCWMDNGAFTALAVIDDDRELAGFAHNDGRPKLWYKSKVADVNKVAS
ncbi:MAG TPA: hypothetical protein ENL09_02580 [Bacteroidetes bacterium]|nr:hypothetical protein [Bacteroidota bacterium]